MNCYYIDRSVLPMKKGKNSDFIHKHKPLTKKEVEERIKQKAKMKKEMTTDAAVLEQNLAKFNKIVDPLMDPETGTVLCWIRRPTQSEWEEIVPTELLEYRGDELEDIPQKVLKKFTDQQFKMMESLIVNPEHNAKWWKSHANLVFQRLFSLHLSGILEELGIETGNF